MASTVFSNREKSLEEKYSHDQDLLFKIKSRRNRLFGLWVAEQLHLKDHECEAYARSLITVGLESALDEKLLSKVLRDFEVAEVTNFTKAQLEKQLTYFFQDARDQLLTPQTP